MRKQPLHFEHGQYNADCDRCGFTFKARQLKLEWTGLRVCDACFEDRHPQEFLRGVPDRQAPPWVRPAQEDETPLNVQPEDL